MQENISIWIFCRRQKSMIKVVVIDAGHGGSKPGAIKQGICEKDIDLADCVGIKETIRTK